MRKISIFNMLSVVTIGVHLYSSLLFADSAEIKSENLCTQCRVSIQQLLSMTPLQKSINEPNTRQSIMTVSFGINLIEQMENTAFNLVIDRAIGSSELANKLYTVAQKSEKVKYKLYYQMALSNSGQTSLYTDSLLPSYEIEKKVPHELWGFYQILDDKAYILLNEYQHGWNADYTLVHEWFHLFDNVSAKYVSEITKKEFQWNELDRLVLEYRSILAEVSHRIQVRSRSDFKQHVLIKNDFRDNFIINKNEIDDKAVIEYVLNLFYPINFKSTSTLNPETLKHNSVFRFNYNPRQYEQFDLENSLINLTEHFTEWISKFFEYTLKLSTKSESPSTGIYNQRLQYRSVPSESLIEMNKSKRALLQSQLKARSAETLIQYIQSYNLNQRVTLDSINSDGSFNLYPGHQGGPSPRTGGGIP